MPMICNLHPTYRDACPTCRVKSTTRQPRRVYTKSHLGNHYLYRLDWRILKWFCYRDRTILIGTGKIPVDLVPIVGNNMRLLSERGHRWESSPVVAIE